MKPIVAANWKMNFTINESLNLIDEIIKRSPSAGAEIIFFPNYISLQSVKQKLVDTAYMVGSQMCITMKVALLREKCQLQCFRF